VIALRLISTVLIRTMEDEHDQHGRQRQRGHQQEGVLERSERADHPTGDRRSQEAGDREAGDDVQVIRIPGGHLTHQGTGGSVLGDGKALPDGDRQVIVGDVDGDLLRCGGASAVGGCDQQGKRGRAVERAAAAVGDRAAIRAACGARGSRARGVRRVSRVASLARGSVDHVECIIEPARGNAITLPFKDAMVCAIHVDDMAEVFARVLLTDKPAHRVYNSGGTSISLGEIADIVRSYLPDAKISFQHERGAKEQNSTYLLDNSRLISEFAIQYRPFRERVLRIINDIRRDIRLPLVG